MERRVDISLIRILAMLMIIYTHCIIPYICTYINQESWNFGIIQSPFYKQAQIFINAIAIPAFCFISGYLYKYLRINFNKYKNTLQFISSKAKRLIVPYIIWYCYIMYFFPGRCNLFGIFYSIDHLWFLLMLMWCFLFSSLCIKFLEKSPLILDIIIFLGFSFLFIIGNHFNLLPSFLCLNMFVLYFPAFFLGILFAKYNVTDLVTTKIPLFIFPIAIALESILLYLFTSENYFSSYTISRIIGLCVVVTLFSYLKLNINRLQFINKDFYKSLDKNSMGIYLLHSIILLYFLEFDYVIQFMNNYELIAPFILLILSVGLSWAISILIRKTPLAFILG